MLANFPEWLGAAIIAAVFALLGFLGRKVFDVFEKRRDNKLLAMQQLDKLKSLLTESKNIYTNQNYLARRLSLSLRLKNSDKVITGLGYDETFYQLYDLMNDEERELFNLIRGSTINSTRRINDDLRKWTEENSAKKLIKKTSSRTKRLDEQLVILKQHLDQWFNKYTTLFKASEKRSLVYLADEKGFGEKFPEELENALDELLAELEGRSFIAKPVLPQDHIDITDSDLVSLRSFIDALKTYRSNVASELNALDKFAKDLDAICSLEWVETKKISFNYLTAIDTFIEFMVIKEQALSRYKEGR